MGSNNETYFSWPFELFFRAAGTFCFFISWNVVKGICFYKIMADSAYDSFKKINFFKLFIEFSSNFVTIYFYY